MGARIGGGGRVSFRPSTPPPLEKIICYLVVFFFATCSPCWSLFTTFYLLMGRHLCGSFLFRRGSFFGLPPPPPTNIFAGAQEYRYGIATH